MATKTVDRVVESQVWLDGLASRLQDGALSVMKPGPIGTTLRNALNGTWLGHPLHPALTDVPSGAWTSALALDLLSARPGRHQLAAGADAAVALGIVGALGSAITGLADWSHTIGNTRRLGIVHALANVIAVSLYAGSLALRADHRQRPAARTLGYLGYGVVAFGAYLGGELAYRCGIGVDHTTFQQGSTDLVDVLADLDLAEGQMRRVLAAGMPVLLARRDGQIHAIAETCSHMGGPLSEGQLEGEVVTCPWHKSRFRVDSGEAVQGPASFPEPRFEARVANGRILVRRVEPGCE